MISTPRSSVEQLPAKLPRIVVYVPPATKAKLEKLAEKRLRPVSNMVLALITEAIEKAEKEGEI
ncbi:ribbon-helix-helix domain-containing protein [Floridanema evergladense]|uniref:CopG-like ribbon-helix-helix domain-containing protein n=1 Tax=Floridaenema evergladense BLCC-F167 TaxID=3153639 RepID=A0ABV4WHE7_9CYAN